MTSSLNSLHKWHCANPFFWKDTAKNSFLFKACHPSKEKPQALVGHGLRFGDCHSNSTPLPIIRNCWYMFITTVKRPGLVTSVGIGEQLK